MITVSFILTIIAIVLIFYILFRLLGAIEKATGLSGAWVNVIYWVLVLLVVIWALGYLGIMQPIIR